MRGFELHHLGRMRGAERPSQAVREGATVLFGVAASHAVGLSGSARPTLVQLERHDLPAGNAAKDSRSSMSASLKSVSGNRHGTFGERNAAPTGLGTHNRPRRGCEAVPKEFPGDRDRTLE